jgi:two-component system response regulator FixJ
VNMPHIYIIDDDEALRHSVEILLDATAQYSTRSFSSGESFLQAAGDLDAGCVLLDVNMPGMSGMDVQRKLKQLDGRFETIFLTGRGDIALAVEAMKAGSGDFIEKPYDSRTLLNAIEAAIGRLDAREGEVEAVRIAREQIGALTPRERDVLLGLIDGKANKIIAYELDISPRTVEIYRANLMDKLEVHSVAETVRIAIAAGLVPVITPVPPSGQDRL